jgi:hypothetical protein
MEGNVEGEAKEKKFEEIVDLSKTKPISKEEE